MTGAALGGAATLVAGANASAGDGIDAAGLAVSGNAGVAGVAAEACTTVAAGGVAATDGRIFFAAAGIAATEGRTRFIGATIGTICRATGGRADVAGAAVASTGGATNGAVVCDEAGTAIAMSATVKARLAL